MNVDGTVLGSWIDTTGNSLSALWGKVLDFLPNLIGAIVIFIVGLIIASLLEKLVERIIHYLRIDTVLRKAEVEGYLERANIKLNVGVFLGKLVYWFVVVGFLIAASDVLHLSQFSDFLHNIIDFIPNVIKASLILLAAMVAANFLRHLVASAVAGAKLHHARGIGVFTWWIVVIFGFSAALPQVGVDAMLVNTLIMGLIAMLALAGGLAFGLGGRDRAAKFLDRWSEEMRK